MIVELITKSQVFTAFAFGGSSLLIVVGVALETFRDIEAQMTMRNYKGFLD
jgi:preprotein translocase subunit SecY